jgi:hypothetical protein
MVSFPQAAYEALLTVRSGWDAVKWNRAEGRDAEARPILALRNAHIPWRIGGRGEIFPLPFRAKPFGFNSGRLNPVLG